MCLFVQLAICFVFFCIGKNMFIPTGSKRCLLFLFLEVKICLFLQVTKDAYYFYF